MARIFEDGFESGDTSKWDAETTTRGTLEVVNKPYAGSKGLKCATQSTNQAANARVEKNINVDELWARAYYWIDETLPLTADNDRFYIIRLQTATEKYINAGIVRVSGATKWVIIGSEPFSYWTGGTQLGTEVTQKSEWVCVELHAKVNNSEGEIELYINGERVAYNEGDASEIDSITSVMFGMTGKAMTGSDHPSATEYPVTLYVDQCVVADSYIGTEVPPPPTVAEQISTMINTMMSLLMVVLIIRMMSSMLKTVKK